MSESTLIESTCGWEFLCTGDPASPGEIGRWYRCEMQKGHEGFCQCSVRIPSPFAKKTTRQEPSR